MHISSTRLALRLLAATVLAGLLMAVAPGQARPAGSAPNRTWAWPLKPAPPPVVRPFERPPGPYAAGHRGVDLAATVGQPVVAAGSGVVAFAGRVAGRPVVSLDHPGGLRTTYEPVEALVTAGDAVERGQVVGAVTAAPGHCLPGTCLHWGLRRGDSYLDPLSLLGWAQVRLLPLWTAVPGRSGPYVPPSGWAPARAPDRGPLLAGG